VTPNITKIKWAHLLHKFKLENTEIMVDHQQPNVLLFSTTVKKQYFDLKVNFDDSSLAIETKKSLESKRH
jgi:hypothetical protein